MTVSKESTPNFQWITKSKSYSGSSGSDITIRVVHGSKKQGSKERVGITIRNKQYEHFKSGYVMFGIDGDKLYIAEASFDVGYKMSKANTADARYIQVMDNAFVEWAHNHIGDYRLDQDSKSGLYYINAERK